MSASIGGALKAYIEAKNLSIQVFRDAPPQGTLLVNPVTGAPTPYCTVWEDISETGDGLEDGTETTLTELVQLDLWQPWRDANDKPLESKTLARAIRRALAGAQLGTAPQQVYAVLLRNRTRLVERSNNIVHIAYTLAVRRAA